MDIREIFLTRFDFNGCFSKWSEDRLHTRSSKRWEETVRIQNHGHATSLLKQDSTRNTYQKIHFHARVSVSLQGNKPPHNVSMFLEEVLEKQN